MISGLYGMYVASKEGVYINKASLRVFDSQAGRVGCTREVHISINSTKSYSWHYRRIFCGRFLSGCPRRISTLGKYSCSSGGNQWFAGGGSVAFPGLLIRKGWTCRLRRGRGGCQIAY